MISQEWSNKGIDAVFIPLCCPLSGSFSPSLSFHHLTRVRLFRVPSRSHPKSRGEKPFFRASS
jgi:hypothetical protein